MTVATEDHLSALGERTTEDRTPAVATPAVDMGQLVTLNSRMHCRMPMERIDPSALPIRQPVYEDGTGMVPLGTPPASSTVVTYRCACGFTIDDPGQPASVSAHALAS